MLLFIVALIIVGLVLALLRSRIDATVYNVIIVLVVLAVALYILSAFGLITLPAAFRFGKGH